MDDKNFLREVLMLLKCATSSAETEHFCENPLMLSCGHYICKDCLEPQKLHGIFGLLSYSAIKCNICNKANKNDLNQQEDQQAFRLHLKQSINEVFKSTLENFKNTFKTCKDMIYNYEERIDNQVQFIKDNILIRIESIKIELDNLYHEFNSELDEIGKKWKVETKNIKFDKFDTKVFENELKELEKSIQESKNMSENNLYKYQKHLKQIQQIMKEYKLITPKLEFKESEEKLTKQMIGELTFEIGEIGDTDSKIINRIKLNKNEQINVQYQPWDLCVLPNGNLLLSNYQNSNLQLYDADMQFIKTISSINGTTHKIIGITSDENNNIYMCDYNTHYVIKTDSNFNQISLFGTGAAGSAQNQLSYPLGICYYNQSVYVCDYSNKRIQKLNLNLVFQASYPLNYTPWYIKNISNVAMVRPNSEAAIYFYDLNTFIMLKKYDGHHGIIGASNNHFYEYYRNNKTFYCYKKNGELVEQIQTNGQGLTNSNNWGSVCVMNGKILSTIYGSTNISAI